MTKCIDTFWELWSIYNWGETSCPWLQHWVECFAEGVPYDRYLTFLASLLSMDSVGTGRKHGQAKMEDFGSEIFFRLSYPRPESCLMAIIRALLSARLWQVSPKRPKCYLTDWMANGNFKRKRQDLLSSYLTVLEALLWRRYALHYP